MRLISQCLSLPYVSQTHECCVIHRPEAMASCLAAAEKRCVHLSEVEHIEWYQIIGCCTTSEVFQGGDDESCTPVILFNLARIT